MTHLVDQLSPGLFYCQSAIWGGSLVRLRRVDHFQNGGLKSRSQRLVQPSPHPIPQVLPPSSLDSGQGYFLHPQAWGCSEHDRWE
jgi:hypothetical protein